MAEVVFFGQAGVLDQAVIPSAVKIAWIVSTTIGTENADLEVIAAAAFLHGMHRLVKIAYEVHKEFESLHAVLFGRIFIAKQGAKQINPVDHAVVMIIRGIGVLVLRAITIARFVESGRVLGDIDKMPAVALITISADLVGPGRNGRQVIVAKELADVLLRHRSQPGIGEGGDNGVSFRAPGQ